MCMVWEGDAENRSDSFFFFTNSNSPEKRQVDELDIKENKKFTISVVSVNRKTKNKN